MVNNCKKEIRNNNILKIENIKEYTMMTMMNFFFFFFDDNYVGK